MANSEHYPVRLTRLIEAAANGWQIEVKCTKCTHSGVFQAANLWWHFHRRGWPDDWRSVAGRLRCYPCGFDIVSVLMGTFHVTRQLPAADTMELRAALDQYRREATAPPPP